jgi:hypothetical protein
MAKRCIKNAFGTDAAHLSVTKYLPIDIILDGGRNCLKLYKKSGSHEGFFASIDYHFTN